MNVKKKDNAAQFRRNALFSVGITFFLAALLSFLSPQMGGPFFGDSYSGFEAGRVAERDVVAGDTKDYTLEGETHSRVEAAMNEVPPVYTVDEKEILRKLHLFEQFAEKAEQHPEDEAVSALMDRLNAEEKRLLNEEDLSFLVSGTERFVMIMALAEELIADIMKQGVFEEEPDMENGRLELRGWEEEGRSGAFLTADEIVTLSNAGEEIRNRLAGTGIDRRSLEVVEKTALTFIGPNVRYDSLLTAEARRSAAATVEPVRGRIQEGERIVRKGFIVTEEDMEKIRALKSSKDGFNFGMIAGVLLYLALIFFLGYVLLNSYLVPRWRAFQYLMLILIFWLFFFLSAGLALMFTSGEGSMLISFYLPTALISMIITSMIGTRPAFILILLSAFSIVPFVPLGKMDLIFIIFSGLMGIQVVRKSEKRIDLVRGGALIAAVHLLLILLIGLLQQKPLPWYPAAASLSVLNAMFCTVLNLSVLPIIEHLLNAPTVFRLIELSDMNTPLFKRMIMVAPGTYSHSVSVANMAESACRAIGANHLLARVGAYYHDIGKIEQPEYFIENQTGNNKHDELKPSLSVAVIKSHVKIGIEKAKELKLPPEVVDIVGQHHGNGLIEYFYGEAVRNGTEEQKINPEEYSYNGSPPVTREAAVVMLADTIEAATRTLKKPTVAKLEKFIWTKIMDKITNRQMINCDLTFHDMEKIKQSFVQILAGHFHSRIEYPKMEEGKRKDDE